LKDEKSGVRSQAAVALGRIGDKRAVQPLIGLLTRDGTPRWTRIATIQALGEIGEPSAVEHVAVFLEARDSGLRSAAGRALAHIGCERARESLRAALDKPNRATIETAVRALARIGCERSREILRAALDKPNAATVEIAAYALIRLGCNSSIHDLRDALMQHGTVRMAETFYNCGEPRLRRAAELWAKQRGGFFEPRRGGAREARWGILPEVGRNDLD